jgi:hypothetical protein
MECETCKNLIAGRERRRSSLCGDCVEKFYSPKTCVACSGRISFEDLKNSSLQQLVNKKHFNNEVELRLCNCFPKFPSQNFSSIQPSDPNEIQVLPSIVGKACSYSELLHQKRKVEQSFYSQNCLPSRDDESEEESEKLEEDE